MMPAIVSASAPQTSHSMLRAGLFIELHRSSKATRDSGRGKNHPRHRESLKTARMINPSREEHKPPEGLFETWCSPAASFWLGRQPGLVIRFGKHLKVALHGGMAQAAELGTLD